MRDYGKVHSSFWSSETVRAMTEDGRYLALYLMTSSHTTIAGVFRLPDGYASEDLKWGTERVAEGFRNTETNGFAVRCPVTQWVWIAKHLEWNPPENPNQRKAITKITTQIPDKCSWKLDFYKQFGRELGMAEPAPHGNPSRTVPEPSRNQEQEQEQEQKKPTATSSASPTTPPDGASSGEQTGTLDGIEPPAVVKRRRLKQVAQEAIDTFNAAPLTKRNGGRVANVILMNDDRVKEVERCLRVASEICQQRNQAPTVTREFWVAYWESCNADDFFSGRGGGGKDHPNWRPDFEYLTRRDTMTKVFERAVAEAETETADGAAS